MEDGLGLTTITGLLAVVTTLSLSRQRILALLVLGHLVRAIQISKKRSTSMSASNNIGDVRVPLAGLALAVYEKSTINTPSLL